MNDDDEQAPKGYRSPPFATRFRPGQSGNPKGRPRKPRITAPEFEGLSEVDLIAIKIAGQPVTVRDGDSATTITMLEAALRAEAVGAAKGRRLDRRDMLFRQEQIASRKQAEKRKDYEDWALIKRFHQKELERGVSRLPHPDDIDLRPDFEVEIVGPLNAKELAEAEHRVLIRDMLGMQAVYDLQCSHRRWSKTQRAGLLPLSMLLMCWLDEWVPARFRLGSSGINDTTNAHLLRSLGDLEQNIKATRRALGLDPGGRPGPMPFVTVAQAEQIFGSRGRPAH